MCGFFGKPAPIEYAKAYRSPGAPPMQPTRRTTVLPCCCPLLVACFALVTSSLQAQHPPGVIQGESYHLVFATWTVFGIDSSGLFPPPFGQVNNLAGADWQVTFSAFDAGHLSPWNGADLVWTSILSDSATDANTRFTIAGPVNSNVIP